MGRKVNLVGRNTLTVSLPQRWVKENNIKKGDELSVGIDKQSIVFSAGKKKGERKEIIVNIDGFSYHTLARYLSVLYKTNFDKVTLTYSNAELFNPKKDKNESLKATIQKITNRLVGAEIVAQSSKKTEIECFVKEEKPDLDKIEKRIYYLMRETAEELLDFIGKDYAKFDATMYDHHDNITKFIAYFLRSLYTSDKSSDEKKMAFVFYSRMDHIVDKLRHLSEKINKHGCTPRLKKFLKEIFELFFENFSCLHKQNIDQDWINKRYNLKKKIESKNLTSKEAIVFGEAKEILDTLNDFSEYIVIKNLQNE